MTPKPSPWNVSAKFAAVVAVIQVILTWDHSFGAVIFGAAIVFVVYWLIIGAWIWFFRAVKERFFGS